MTQQELFELWLLRLTPAQVAQILKEELERKREVAGKIIQQANEPVQN